MTIQEVEKIAEVLKNKYNEVGKWKLSECQSLSLAYIEDFLTMLQTNDKNFDRSNFINLINK